MTEHPKSVFRVLWIAGLATVLDARAVYHDWRSTRLRALANRHDAKILGMRSTAEWIQREVDSNR